MLLVLAMPVEWRGRYVSFSLIAARLDLSVGAVRDALFANVRQCGLYFADARDSPKTITHVASGSLVEPPRPQGVHDLGDRVTENNLMIIAGDETRQSRSSKRQVVAQGTAYTSPPPPPSRTPLTAPLSAQSSRESAKPRKTTSTGSARAEQGRDKALENRFACLLVLKEQADASKKAANVLKEQADASKKAANARATEAGST